MCRCHHPSRRTVLGLLAAAPLVAACKKQTTGPEDIRYGRETCEICGMIISDPRYAAEVRGGPDRRLAKFDDIGDALHWWQQQDWKDDGDVELWVMDSNTGADWLNAREVFYHSGTISPMDYGYAAVANFEPGTVQFPEMFKAVMDRGLSSRCLPIDHGGTSDA